MSLNQKQCYPKLLNPQTNRCVKQCENGKVRNESFRCVAKTKKSRSTSEAGVLARNSSSHSQPSPISSTLQSLARSSNNDSLENQEMQRVQDDSVKSSYKIQPCVEVTRLDAEIKKLTNDKKTNIINCNKEKYWTT